MLQKLDGLNQQGESRLPLQGDSNPFLHLPGIVAFGVLLMREVFKFLARVWPKAHTEVNNGNGASALTELKLTKIVREAVEPLREEMGKISEKLDRHIDWHLQQKD